MSRNFASLKEQSEDHEFMGNEDLFNFLSERHLNLAKLLTCIKPTDFQWFPRLQFISASITESQEAC